MDFNFNDILSALTHIRGGMPLARLSKRVHLGVHRSVFFGPSDDLFDIQEYDEDRDPPNQIIDSLYDPDEDIIWARKNIEPHEIKVNFFVDLSSSLDAGLDFKKRKMLLETIGFIGITAARYQDPVGLIGFTDKVVLNMRPRCGQNNFYFLLRSVYDFLERQDSDKNKLPRRKTDFFAILDFIRRSFDKPCFIPVISDFVGFEKVLGSSLLRTVAAKHELLFIFLDDPAEYHSMRGIGYLRTVDIETGERQLISRNNVSEAYKSIRRKRKELRQELRRMGIDSRVLEYGKHFSRLRRFFMARHKYLRAS